MLQCNLNYNKLYNMQFDKCIILSDYSKSLHMVYLQNTPNFLTYLPPQSESVRHK